MRRTAALAGTFFNSWADFGFKETWRQTREWLQTPRSGGSQQVAGAGTSPGFAQSLSGFPKGSAPTTTWITRDDWLHAESVKDPVPTHMDGPPDRVIFIAPPFGEGSGGHWDIMRLSAALQAEGTQVLLRIYMADGRVDLTQQREMLREHFPITHVECGIWDRSEVTERDTVVATGWNTAYAALNCPAGRRIYMVQDYEPWFYSIGTDSVLADMTYDFGFDILAAGEWLGTKLADRNIGSVAKFPLGYDGDVYRSHASWEERTGVLFYFRHVTPRRAWEYGIEALHIFHQRNPTVPIHLVGGRTKIRMPFPATIHDIMTPEELATLYNRIRVGMAISLTNTSLLPVELLACGTEVVSNDSDGNRANLWSLPGVTLAELKIQSLADALDHAYATPVDPQVLSQSTVSRQWTEAFDEAVKFVLAGQQE